VNIMNAGKEKANCFAFGRDEKGFFLKGKSPARRGIPPFPQKRMTVPIILGRLFVSCEMEEGFEGQRKRERFHVSGTPARRGISLLNK
jgi:hypothetical protein